MVLKGANRSQNTGNTLRRSGLRSSPAVIVKHVKASGEERYQDSGLIFENHQSAIDDGNFQPITQQQRGRRWEEWQYFESTPFSLNKKQRWNLPYLIKESLYVRKGSNTSTYFKGFDDSYDVTLMVHDKIARRDNSTCKSVFTTKTPTPLVDVENGMPHGKEWPYTIMGSMKEARKVERKRVKGEAKKAAYFNGTSWLKQQAEPSNKVVEVKKSRKPRRCRGQQRPMIVDNQINNEQAVNPASKTEIQYDVYQPCSKTSGLAYNVKCNRYNDGTIAEGRSSKSKKRSGNRGIKKTDVWDDVNDFEEALNDYYEDLNYNNSDYESEEDDAVIKDEMEDEMVDYEEEMIAQAIEKSLLQALLEKAEQAKNQCEKMSKVAGFGLVANISAAQKKYFLPENEGVDKKRKLVQIDDESRTVTSGTTSMRTDTPFNNPLHPRWFDPTPKPMVIVVPAEDVHPVNLEDKYSSHYIESKSVPRSFMINITDEVRTMFLTYGYSKAWIQKWDFDIHFIGEVQDIKDHHGMKLSCSIAGNLNALKELVIAPLEPQDEHRLQDVVHHIVKTCTSFPNSSFKILEDKGSKAPHPGFKAHNKKFKTLDTVTTAMNASVESKSPEEAIVELREKEEFVWCEKPDDTEIKNITCNICYIEMPSPYHEDGSIAALAMRDCQHWFCKPCWKNHIATQVFHGIQQIQCPEYDCNSVVDPCTILSLAGAKHYRNHQRLVDQTLLNTTHTWCPNANCGRALHVQAKDKNTPLECICGHISCGECKKDSHWPLSCKDAALQIKRMIEHGDIKDPSEDGEPLMLAFVKKCPNCGELVEKNGGCPYMSCVCGKAFCWGCNKPFANGLSHNNCHTNAGDRRNTKKVPVRQTKQRVPNPSKHYEAAVNHFHARSEKSLEKYKRQTKQLVARIMKYDATAFENWGDVPEIGSLEVAVSSSGLVAHSSVVLQKQQLLHDFILSAVKLLLQLHYLLEHSMILLETCQRRRRRHLGNTQSIAHAVEKMEFTAAQIHNVLEMHTAVDRDLPRKLAFYVHNGHAAVRLLVRLLQAWRSEQE